MLQDQHLAQCWQALRFLVQNEHMGYPHPFSTTIKTGIAANSSANPAIIKIKCSQFRQSLPQKHCQI
jgi:hypothetical protein